MGKSNGPEQLKSYVIPLVDQSFWSFENKLIHDVLLVLTVSIMDQEPTIFQHQ